MPDRVRGRKTGGCMGGLFEQGSGGELILGAMEFLTRTGVGQYECFCWARARRYVDIGTRVEA